MTVEEKREVLREFCKCRYSKCDCDTCVLTSVKGWTHPLYTGCPSFYNSPESDLDKALEVIGYKVETQDDAPSNPYWERVTAAAMCQRSKGIREYGKGIEDDTADIDTRLNRIEEELIDALMYLEHLRDGINRIKEVVN